MTWFKPGKNLFSSNQLDSGQVNKSKPKATPGHVFNWLKQLS